MLADRIHHISTFILSVFMVLLGVALIAQAIDEGGSPISARLLVGILLLAAGVGRLYVEIRRRRTT